MADTLYLSLWFPDFEIEEMLPRALAILRQFPFSTQEPGVTYVSLHPVSWDEPTVIERRFRPGVPPPEAVLVAADLLHEDYGYVFELAWDLWQFDEKEQQWAVRPSLAKLIVHGEGFDDGAYQQEGHIQLDLGSDEAFIQENATLTPEAETHVRANVQKLVEFAVKAEKNSGANSRLLWSDSEDNLAQKLISRLQKVH